MASFVSASAAPAATLICNASRVKSAIRRTSLSTICGPTSAGGLKLAPKIQVSKATTKSLPMMSRFKTRISCSAAQPETLEIVQSTIAKQLSIDESTVTPQTKFADLGADSLDTVEIMMALEEKFGVSIGESGAENIATVQDAADLIEKVKTASA